MKYTNVLSVKISKITYNCMEYYLIKIKIQYKLKKKIIKYDLWMKNNLIYAYITRETKEDISHHHVKSSFWSFYDQ